MEWKKVQGSQEEKPLEVDREISPGSVYVRKNIERITVESEDGTKTELWQYDECCMTSEEYGKYQETVAAVDFVLDGKNEETAQILDALLGGAR